MTQKPPYGSPCNNCGQCCKAQLCPLGQHLFRRFYGPCPALTLDNTCGVVADPGRYNPRAIATEETLREDVTLLIGAGIGCDAQLVDEPRNQQFVTKMRRFKTERRARINEALRRWQ